MKMNKNGTFEIERNDYAFPCPKCGGYSGKVSCTKEEKVKYGCYIDKLGSDCCAIAFICNKCGNRFAMSRPSPECNW